MKVLILCGGMGTRLREETEFRPKPMIKIGEQPIIWHIMKHYAHYGFKDFVLALGYKGEMIKEYFLQYQLMTRDFTVDFNEGGKPVFHGNGRLGEDWRVTLASTGERALKGARIKRAQKYIESGGGDGLFMMTYGDGVSTIDLNKLIDFHRSHGRLVTVSGVVPSMRFGELNSRNDGSVAFHEKPPGGAALVNGGYYVLDSRVFDMLEAHDDCDFESALLEDLAREHQLMMYRHEGFWHCMDNVRDMEVLNRMWKAGSPPWAVWEEPAATRS